MRSRIMLRATIPWLLTLGSTACHTSGGPAQDAKVTSSAATRSLALADASDAQTTADAGPLAQEDGGAKVLWPIYQGGCPSSSVYAVGDRAVHILPHGAWSLDGDDARILYHATELNRMMGIVRSAGGIDEAHMWIEQAAVSRALSGSSLRFAKDRWETQGEDGGNGLSSIIAQPDGSVWATGRGDLSMPNRFLAWSKDGVLLKQNLPGTDMTYATRMDSGELVRDGVVKERPALLRWSPSRKVDDLVVKDGPKVESQQLSFKVGRARAALIVAEKASIYLYRTGEDKLVASNLNGRIGKMTSSWMSKNDELFVTIEGGKLLVESSSGVASEETLPEVGKLVAEAWLLAESGALYNRQAGTWSKFTLSPGPWSGTASQKIEWVKVVAGEIFVETVHTDTGFGRTKPNEIRTLYGSKRRAAPLRCGAPFRDDHIAAFPKSATASCTDLMVVVSQARTDTFANAYPPIGAALKGNAALGDTLKFVEFGPGTKGAPAVLGIATPSMAEAKEISARLAKVGSFAPEVVCGPVPEKKRRSFNVKDGTFTSLE
jgi:hypothetical protein